MRDPWKSPRRPVRDSADRIHTARTAKSSGGEEVSLSPVKKEENDKDQDNKADWNIHNAPPPVKAHTKCQAGQKEFCLLFRELRDLQALK